MSKAGAEVKVEAASESLVRTPVKRIGVHLGTSGGCWTAVNRAVEAGANTFQIFSSSPRQWRAADVKPEDATKMRALRAEHGIGPVSIHASYLINLCSQTESVRVNSTAAFRGEVERALALGAEYLVLHPGSWKGLTREEGLRLAAESIVRAVDGLDFSGIDFRILIENTAGAEFSLGGKLEQVAELVERLRPCAPVGVCLDTCHVHVAGYDIVSEDGYLETMMLVRDTVGFDAVKVWHCNDAKAARGSKLDRHEHIGEGTIGAAAFRRLLRDPRFAHAAFIAETPVDSPGDEARNVGVLRTLAAG
jgi:deoxyribonuclease-4